MKKCIMSFVIALITITLLSCGESSEFKLSGTWILDLQATRKTMPQNINRLDQQFLGIVSSTSYQFNPENKIVTTTRGLFNADMWYDVISDTKDALTIITQGSDPFAIQFIGDSVAKIPLNHNGGYLVFVKTKP